MNADRFNNMNKTIDQLNMALFELSICTANFKLFDNLKFGISHLARDGIHFNSLIFLVNPCYLSVGSTAFYNIKGR